MALKTHPLLWKLPLLALIFGAMATLVSINLFPQVPLVFALLHAAAGVVAILAVMSIGIVVASGVNAYALDKGGTDTQWLWFKADPPGLVGLREKARMENDDAIQKPEPTLRSPRV